MRFLIFFFLLVSLSGCAQGQQIGEVPAVDDVPSQANLVDFSEYISGLDEPWGFVFTGDNDLLITEKKGQLRQVVDGALIPDAITGIPVVNNTRQGGLLDVAVDPDFADNQWVYICFSHALEGGSGPSMTKVIRGKVKNGNWENEQTLWQAKPSDYVDTVFHYGCRITFDHSGHLYFSIGDRGRKDKAQDVSVPNGKIHRIKRDGSIPKDNPFVGTENAYGSIYSYGNRNAQGLVWNPLTAELWETEHGPRGGDELNLIEAGKNYGWPEISYGINYSGTILTEHTSLPGMEQPASQWTPSIAVSGVNVYQGDLFPEWKGRLLVSSLAYESLRLVEVKNGKYVSEVAILDAEGRIRDSKAGPDGAIYVALPEQIVRLSPAAK